MECPEGSCDAPTGDAPRKESCEGRCARNPTAKRFDSALAKLTKEVTIASSIEDHNKVRFQNGALHSLESLGEMQEIMEATLRGERSDLLEVFGGDCRRVAMKRARVEQLQEVLSVSNHVGDRRPNRSIDLCQSIEDVLTSMELGQALAAAKRQARSRVMTMAEPTAEVSEAAKGRSHAASEAVYADIDVVSPINPRPHQLLRKNTEERALAFKDLDDADSYVEARAIVEGLFEVLDIDGTGVLEGDEAEQAINDLVMHVMRESADRAAKYGGRKFVPSEDSVRKWVWAVVDKDGDGKITAAEAVAGFMAVVDDIDEKEERGAAMAKTASVR